MKMPGTDVAPAHLSEFSGMLASAVERGIPLERAVGVIASQVRGRPFRKALRRVARDLEEGVSLPGAMRRFPKLFPEEYPPLVETGLEGGGLAEVLRHAERYYALRAKLSRGLSRILTYVGTCFAVCIGFLVFLSFVSDSLLRIDRYYLAWWWSWYSRKPFQWPWMTRFLMWLARDGLDILITVALGLIILAALGRLFNHLVSRSRVGYWLPAWGRVQKSRDLGLFCTSMALRTGAGASLQESLMRAAEAIPNRYAESQVRRVRKRVEEGEALSSALFRTRLFPRMLSWGVSAGETRGDLSGIFRTFAEIYAAELERSFELLLFVMTPLGLVIVGNIGILMVLAFYIPVLRWAF